jgi:hypothetical protein
VPGPTSSSSRGGRESADPRSPTTRALLWIGAWAVALTAWGYAAQRWLPVQPRHGWNAELERRAPPYARFDSGWYLGIAERGYGPARAPGEPSEHAFFPLYPILVRIVAKATGADPVRVGPLVSTACALGALWLFWREALRRLPPRLALHSLAFLLLFPTSFFLLAMYSESLFLLLAIAAFAAVSRRRLIAAGILAGLAGLTRAPAVALCLPLFFAAWPRSGETASRRGRLAAVAVALAPAAGVLLWIAAADWITGIPGAYARAQSGWQRGISPISGAVRWAAALPDRIARGDLLEKPAFVLDYVDVAIFAAITAAQARRRRWGDAAFTAGALALPIATGIPASVPRYVLVVYPAFFALAEVFDGRPLLRRLWWLGSAVLLLAGAAAFVHWRWVA